MAFFRTYTTPDGESHFGEIDFGLDVQSGGLQSPIQPVSGLVYRRLPADYFNDWHPAGRRQWVIPLVNEVEMQVSDGEVRRLKPGDMCLVEDTSGRGHITRCLGQEHTTLFVRLS